MLRVFRPNIAGGLFEKYHFVFNLYFFQLKTDKYASFLHSVSYFNRSRGDRIQLKFCVLNRFFLMYQFGRVIVIVFWRSKTSLMAISLC